MRAVLEDMKTGEVRTYDVPSPELRPGGVLVKTHFSAISSGTERVKVETGEKSLLQKAMARPDLVKQVVDYARQNGVRAAYEKVQARLDSLSTMGYSSAGVVLEVGEGVTGLQPGDRVACAGGGYSNHCEINFVPRNLVAKVPANVGLDAAALGTIGAIAMQGLRQAQINFGETVLVVGAGLLGVLACQMARAAGCRVIAVDLNADRARAATNFGAHIGLSSEDPLLGTTVLEFSRYGVDAAIITAATPSAAPLELASKLARDRGRIVVVGDVGMGVSRGNMYMKELSLLMSRSYGAGRYDASYEEQGHDYPIGYVRWTEQRNIEAFLDLLASGSVNVAPLIASRYAVENAGQAYQDIRAGKSYTAVIDYTGEPASKPAPAASAVRPPVQGQLRVGAIGAGGFARSIIFPALKSDSQVVFQSVATATGTGAESAKRSFKFSEAQTAAELISNPNIDAVFIASRHDSHAKYVVDGLRHGKAVFVEKPLATTRAELGEVVSAYSDELRKGSAPFVMVGFNRRFAPATQKLNQFFAGHNEPMVLNVRCNAGYAPKDAWVHADGGRIVGEFCHFVDWARAVVGSPIKRVFAAATPDGARYTGDNVNVTLTFADGSVANLQYLANGNAALPKEFFEVFCQGQVARIDDFAELHLGRAGKLSSSKSTQDKGHRSELQETIEAMRNGKPSPIPFEQLLEVSEATLAVGESIRSGQVITIGEKASATGAE